MAVFTVKGVCNLNYDLYGRTVLTDRALAAYAPFMAETVTGEPRTDAIRVTFAPKMPMPEGTPLEVSELRVIRVSDGWVYTDRQTPPRVLTRISSDYRQLQVTPQEPEELQLSFHMRTALECEGLFRGILSLHAAAVALDGVGIAFTAPSGTGKSTRAAAWQSALGAEILSGDRPALIPSSAMGREAPAGDKAVYLCGMPWDGKENLHIRRSVPLKALMEVRRSDGIRVRTLSVAQKTALLMRQCFIPMWDAEAAAAAIARIRRFALTAPMYRVFCGPDGTAAKALRDLLFSDPGQILPPSEDLLLPSQWEFRAHESMLVPKDQTVHTRLRLNPVAEFICENLVHGISREDLLFQMLSTFDVSPETAGADLDEFLQSIGA